VALRGSVDGNQVDAIEVGTIDEDDVRLSLVTASKDAAHAGADALRADLDRATAQPSCLALSTNEAIPEVEYEVIALIDAEREETAYPFRTR
jgi:hypothetical protein